jgi:hypothetical protein
LSAVRTSFVIAVVALLLAGCSSQKPAEKPAASSKSAIIAERVEGGVSPYKVALDLDPAQPITQKPTKFRFTVTDAAGKPAAGLSATIALVMPIMDMGKNEFPAKEISAGMYEGSGAFTMDDEWEVFLTLERGKEKPVKHVFNVRVSE